MHWKLGPQWGHFGDPGYSGAGYMDAQSTTGVHPARVADTGHGTTATPEFTLQAAVYHTNHPKAKHLY